MMFHVEDFAPIEGAPNQWVHSSLREMEDPETGEPIEVRINDGWFTGRPGQTLESFVAELNDPDPAPRVIIPDRVSRRQFRLQLIDDGLLALVEGWIATQDERTQAAYADSGTFVRTDAMLQDGFAALEFDSLRVDQFFTAAAKL
ncbi:hypothetical protein [Phyllobacterium lublinensis]|uniref:hypothetical protein n=1 Tax=Phyllobacterium lublinensis TaxID=2875708 RepID=UPI001CCD2D13|nr:hypothetical protein [Phyllobacterium sp. 2063]MBZ9653562.1 hypothetical protein [Phyllobacterium sp. 2063]